MRGVWPVAFLLTLAAGCQTARPRWDSQIGGSPISEAAVGWNAGQLLPAAYTETVGMAASVSSPVELTLASALATALERNPDLVALRGTESVGRAGLEVAATYPFNPYVQANAFTFSRDREGNSTSLNHQAEVVQTFELAHQWRHRLAGGAANLSSTRWTIAQSELQSIAQTERLFLTALYRRAVRDQLRSIADTNAHLVGVMQRRFEAGQATAADVATVRVDAWSSRQQQELAEANYQTALLDLRRQLNLPPDLPVEIVGDLARWQWLPLRDNPRDGAPQPLDQHGSRTERNSGDAMSDSPIEQLVETRPDVMAARAEATVADAALELAYASRVPNLQLGPTYERDDAGTLFFGFKSQIDIPIVNNGMPLVRQRQAEFRQKLMAVEQMEQKARLEATTALNRYERARQLVQRGSDGLANQLPDQLKQIEDLFEAGQVDVLRVFAARNSLLQAQRAYLDSLNELALAAADVTASTGLLPDELIVMEPAK